MENDVRLGPDYCPGCGADTYICQVCGRVLCGGCQPSVWRPDITGRASSANICPSCLEAYEVAHSAPKAAPVLETVKEYLCRTRAAGHATRLAKLKEIGGVPAVILEREAELVEEAKLGQFGFKGFAEYAGCLVLHVTPVTGRGGKRHLRFELADGQVIGLFDGPYSKFFKPWVSSQKVAS